MPESLANSGSLLFVIAFVCLTLGYVFGWLISSIQRGREERGAEKRGDVSATAQDATKQGGDAPDRASQTPASLLAVRSQGGQGLSLELRGQSFSSPGEMSTDDRRLTEKVLSWAADWLAQASPQVRPASEAPAAPAVAPDGVVSAQAHPTEVPVASSVINGMTNAVADALSPAGASKKEAVPLSIVQQIDEILQGLLEGSSFAGQKIFLEEDLHSGVVVRVNDQLYEGVEAVPEGEIKRLLRTAVREWERRQEARHRR